MEPFSLGFCHPKSPRQRHRWLDGTRLTERQLRNEQEQAASALDAARRGPSGEVESRDGFLGGQIVMESN